MTTVARESLNNSLGLLAFAAASAILLGGTYGLTRPTIEATERQDKIRLISQTLPAGGFDNDLVADARPLGLDPLLGLKRPGQYYVARQAGQPVAVVLEVTAPDGYSGEIKLLVGIRADASVAGVRVTAHKETPGLGDYIEVAKSDWIRRFEGKSLHNPAPDAWRVKKDGGAFDYMAGATITPRAVVKAVKKALEYFESHQAELLAATTEEVKHVR